MITLSEFMRLHKIYINHSSLISLGGNKKMKKYSLIRYVILQNKNHDQIQKNMTSISQKPTSTFPRFSQDIAWCGEP